MSKGGRGASSLYLQLLTQNGAKSLPAWPVGTPLDPCSSGGQVLV